MSGRKRPVPPRNAPDDLPVPHLFVLDPDVPLDPWSGEGCCATCKARKGSDMHELPDGSEAAEEAARRIGERGEPDGGAQA